MLEHDGGNQPEKPTQHLVPFADLEQESGGRFMSGIQLPPYLDGEVGIDIDRLTALCNFVNLQRVAILPLRHDRDNGDVVFSSINPDGTTTGINIANPTTQPYSGDLIRDPNVAERPITATVTWADAVVRIDTEDIAQNLVRKPLGKTTPLRSSELWANELDAAISGAVQALGKENIAEVEFPHEKMMVLSTLYQFVGPLILILADNYGGAARYTVFGTTILTAFNIFKKYKSADLKSGHWQPSLFLGNQHDRAFLHELNLKFGRPIVKPIQK